MAADRRACPPSASSAAAARTTTGTWACPARAGRARRSTTTGGPSTAARAARSPTRTGTWRSGTWSSCRTSAASSSPKDGHPPIGELPRKNIDTGMGVERVATLLQGVDNVYETDLVRPVIARAEELVRPPVRRGPRRRRAVPGDRRPRPIRRDDHRRRGDAVATRAAATCCAGCCAASSARPGCSACTSRCCGTFAEVVRDAMAPSYPELVQRLRADLGGGAGRGGGLPGHAHRRLADLRHRGRRDPAGRGPAARRRQGVPAARHVRLPDRPHPGDGGRGRADASTRTASAH